MLSGTAVRDGPSCSRPSARRGAKRFFHQPALPPCRPAGRGVLTACAHRGLRPACQRRTEVGLSTRAPPRAARELVPGGCRLAACPLLERVVSRTRNRDVSEAVGNDTGQRSLESRFLLIPCGKVRSSDPALCGDAQLWFCVTSTSFWPCHAACGFFPDEGSNLCPPRWERGALTAALPGKPSLVC